MVVLNFDTLWQFNQLKGDYFLKFASTPSFRPRSPPILPVEKQSSDTMSVSESNLFFDAVQESPEPYNGDFFFETETWLDEPKSPDLLPFTDLCPKRTLVDCRHHDTVFRDESCAGVSFQALVYLTKLGDHANNFLQFGTVRHPVTFDTGASLGITFDINDFDGPLTKPKGDL